MRTLDLRGYHCPVTTMRLKRELRLMAPGEIVNVLVNDDKAKVDFPALIKTGGHTLLQITHAAKHMEYEVQKKGAE